MAERRRLRFEHDLRHPVSPAEKPEDDIKSASAAGLGFLFCFLATVTAPYGEIQLGTYWNWDPRQTSIFVLLLIYGPILRSGPPSR